MPQLCGLIVIPDLTRLGEARLLASAEPLAKPGWRSLAEGWASGGDWWSEPRNR